MRSTGACLADGSLGAGLQGHRRAALGVVALLQFGQLQQPVDDALQAFALLHHLGRKFGTVGSGQLVLQQLARAPDGRHGAFEFVCQCAHVALDVIAPLQPGTHAVHGAGQVAQLARYLGHGQRRGGRGAGVMALAIGRALHAQGVVAQAAHVPHHPQRHGHADGGRERQ